MNPNAVGEEFFTYDALNLLHNDLFNVLSQVKIDDVILVPFKINFSCRNPFNTFLLTNDFTDSLNFPCVNVSNANESDEYFLSIVYCYLYSLLLSNDNIDSSKYDLETFASVIEFKGVYIYKNNVYAFIDLTKLDIHINLMNRDSNYWFALIDEIVNKKQICNITINYEVTDFFLKNNAFIYFKNSKKEPIEVPSVVYTGSNEKMLQFRFMFGNVASDNNAILSSGFYFTNYTNSFRQGGWSPDYKVEFKYGKKITEDEHDGSDKNGKYVKGGIIRYAIFLGNNLVKMNYPNDSIDDSEIKKKKINLLHELNNNEYIYEKMILRISDHDGLWKQNYDSVYLGNLELDNGEYLKNTPIYVVDDYYCHTPLSYHYIDKKTLGNKFDENCNYQIM